MKQARLLGKSNHALRPLRKLLVALKRGWLRRRWGMDIDPSCEMSLSAKFDTVYPKGVHVGRDSYIAFEARILTHDMTRGLYLDTRVGANCFIGGRALILPGVEIGDGCIIGAGSVVTKSVPAGCAVAGNPARVILEKIEVGRFGRMTRADAAQEAFFEAATGDDTAA